MTIKALTPFLILPSGEYNELFDFNVVFRY
jgi:hypothetical protein